MQLDTWELFCEKESIGAVRVPGDITDAMYRAGKIADPYYGLHHNDLGWILRKEFTYVSRFDFDRSAFDAQSRQLLLCFEGIDLFADIYLNGTHLGRTENMFLEYAFDISETVRDGYNEVRVQMHSTLEAMDALDASAYFGVFNSERVLLRKEQCGFGWDWAPNVPGYGIWKPVTLSDVPKERIVDLRYETDTEGNAVFFAELNYFERSHFDNDGNFVEVEQKHDDRLRVILDKTPDGKTQLTQTVRVDGNKCFLTLYNPDRRLWWPNGYGEQPLYRYTVQLLRDGKVQHERHGRLGYRTVSLRQAPIGQNRLGYTFCVNGQEIFIKGSNWVPIDCFTGCVPQARYEDLLQKAKAADMNMLRVWGGGIYENDIFYDLCDELGIAVWQDFMFACGDVPEDNEAWLQNAVSECEYQVRRLRNHPSLLYWCGGNEKTGSFGTMVKLGERFVDVTLRGVVGWLDPTRPYGRQSPCSFTDAGNDVTSGECHCSGFEKSLHAGVSNYRRTVAQTTPSFVSECAVMGPMSEQAFARIFPADKLWPMNDYWVDRLTTNPYAAIKMNFCEQEAKLAGDLYGEPTSLSDFVRKGMLLHAEALLCEAEHARAHKGVASVFLNWMYGEIWPTGTWSVVDYYGEPKQAYYALRQAYRPVLFSCCYLEDGKTYLFGANDTTRVCQCRYTAACKQTDGTVVWSEEGQATLPVDRAWSKPLDRAVPEGAYISVDYFYDGRAEKTLYSPCMWRQGRFAESVTFTVKQTQENACEVKVCSDRFAKAVRLQMPDNYRFTYSDNYFDLEAGESKQVTVTAPFAFDGGDLKVSVFCRAGAPDRKR